MASLTTRTRLLIISDTHGVALFDERDLESEDPNNPCAMKNLFRKMGANLPHDFKRPLPTADIAIHCGDLTMSSTLDEFKITFDLMREIDAPLKLVIPGNHDGSLHPAFWEEKCDAQEKWIGPAEIRPLRQRPSESLALVTQARQDGIHVLLDEGTYHFVLPSNGAKLTVYASPWTPAYGDWGFQYDPGAHAFAIQPGTDVAMTHGPPHRILDRTLSKERAGCAVLRESVRRARPRVHCFGHIHEAAGYALARWDEDGEVVEKVSRRNEGELRRVSLCGGDPDSVGLEEGKDTLFVNAAIMNVRYLPFQSPWLVDLELPRPDEEHKMKAEETQRVLAALRTANGH